MSEPSGEPKKKARFFTKENASEYARRGGLALAKIKPTRTESHIDDVLRGFDEIEAMLVSRGFPPTSPWWRSTIERWYRSGCRQLVARVGRRGGKSSTLSRLAVAEALYGHHDVPPGDTAYAAVISTDRKESVGRLRTIEAILEALRMDFDAIPGIPLAIVLKGRRVGFRVFTASIQGVSGFTAFFVLCDEVAKWKDADTGVNPATEVLKSVRPTMITLPNGRIVLSSSPFGMLDAHFDTYEAGDTEFQITAKAPTWEANPTVTEDDTRGLEPDHAAWSREYAAVPQAEVESSLLTEELVDRATRAELDITYQAGHRYIATMDPATRRHVWTLIVATQGADRKRRVVLAREWRPERGKRLVPSEVLSEIAAVLGPYRTRQVITDQASADALAELGRQAGLVVLDEAWTQAEIRRTSEHVLKLLQQELLELPPDPMVKVDLLGIRKVITRTGMRYEFAEQRGRHSDYAPAILRAVDDIRWSRGEDPPPEKTVQQKAQDAKARFLKDREREKERAERHGRLPPTHRNQRMRRFL